MYHRIFQKHTVQYNAIAHPVHISMIPTYIYLYYQTSKLNKVQWQKGRSKCFNAISWPSECMVHPAHPIRISTHVACLSLNQLLCAEIKTRPSCAWHVGPLALERVIICCLICYVTLTKRCNANNQRTDWRVIKCSHVYISPSWNSGGRYPGFLIEWILYWIESIDIE